LEDFTWLYRGVPEESPESKDVESSGEVSPACPNYVGEDYRRWHMAGFTDSGYTSWTTDRTIAEAAAESSSNLPQLSGRIRIFKVRISSLDRKRVFPGRGDEEEFLIEGTIENVELSSDTDEDEDG